ncbi:rCG59576 [Rattus norvegicus]|uniref:RCG59576 n=1 Tax=Rattus norvegicus TaxID=10116 RepID=A6HTC5_RAT|nr:rCG59576 [Rattus norvegicus]
MQKPLPATGYFLLIAHQEQERGQGSRAMGSTIKIKFQTWSDLCTP